VAGEKLCEPGIMSPARGEATDTLSNVPGGAPQFDPFIRYYTFSDSSVNFTVILRAREYVDQYLLEHAINKRLHQRYRQEGITIPFPIRTVVPGAAVVVRELGPAAG
jgi:hypothetical protein